MALEDSGWKGARGTSLLADPSVTTFARAMTRLMARKGKISIESLEIDGKPVAMGVVLESNNRAYFWKLAYDEAFARYSPGVQLMLELSRRLSAREDVALVDFCARPGHAMIERLWPQRMSLADVFIPVGRGSSAPSFETAARREQARRALRSVAKKAFLCCGDGPTRLSPWSASDLPHKWLWFARVVKTRTLATKLVSEGHVRVNGARVATPAKPIGVDDVLTIALECHR